MQTAFTSDDLSMEEPLYLISQKNLSRSQTKWSAFEREAYAVLYATQKLRYFLANRHFVVKTALGGCFPQSAGDVKHEVSEVAC